MTVETATDGSSSREVGAGLRHRYCVYGIVVLSDTPLALPEYTQDGLGEFQFIGHLQRNAGLDEIVDPLPGVLVSVAVGVLVGPPPDWQMPPPGLFHVTVCGLHIPPLTLTVPVMLPPE